MATNSEDQSKGVDAEALFPATEVSSPENGRPIEGVFRPDRRALTERRSYPRYPFTTSSEIMDLASGAECAARTSDISLGGCFVDTSSPFPTGTVVKARLTKDNKSFVAQAVVASSMASMGMGLKFVNIGARQLQVLTSWIGQLSGELPPESAAFDQEEVVEASADLRLKDEQKYVLSELIVALMRKGILTEGQGKEMIRRLLL